MFNKLFAPIKAGNEYRKEKYGLPIDFGQSREIWNRYKQSLPKTLSMFASSKEIEDIEHFKNKFHYWDEWSGSRFIRRENPNLGTAKGNKIELGTVCRSNPVTGYWEAF